MMPWLKTFLIAWAVLSASVFALYGIDKIKAVRNEWRIPEKTLLGAALLGAPGALAGMFVFKHKIRKPKFCLGVPLILAAEIILLIMIVNKTAG